MAIRSKDVSLVPRKFLLEQKKDSAPKRLVTSDKIKSIYGETLFSQLHIDVCLLKTLSLHVLSRVKFHRNIIILDTSVILVWF